MKGGVIEKKIIFSMTQLQEDMLFRTYEKNLINKGEKEMRNQKGITLVALVVTIIVLLILAGVSLITSITGRSPIIKLKI